MVLGYIYSQFDIGKLNVIDYMISVSNYCIRIIRNYIVEDTSPISMEIRYIDTPLSKILW